jgi:hypothetical protein
VIVRGWMSRDVKIKRAPSTLKNRGSNAKFYSENNIVVAAAAKRPAYLHLMILVYQYSTQSRRQAAGTLCLPGLANHNIF